MNHTKSAIIDAFWQLLEERPYTKITVRDIVELCQVNRNTFYYHFHDIPELLETTIKSDVDQIIQTNGHFGSPTDCLIPIVERCLIRKKAMLHRKTCKQKSHHKEKYTGKKDPIGTQQNFWRCIEKRGHHEVGRSLLHGYLIEIQTSAGD